MKLSKHDIIFLLFSIISASCAKAQHAETQYYYTQEEAYKLIAIDSSLNNMEEYNFMRKDTWESFNLGNTGQAHQSLSLEWDDQKGFKSGMTHFDLYKFDREKIKYYKIHKPYSEIYYYMGSKRENIFGASFAQNVKNRLEYGLNFHRVLSNGVYRKIRAKNGDFSLYGIYSSKNSRYNLKLDMAFSKVKTEENGGLQVDFINDRSNLESNKEFYAIRIAEGLTEHKNFDMLISNVYNFGYSTIDSISDSLALKKFHPSYSLSYSIGTQKNTYAFVDKDATLDYYGDFFQNNDSTYYRLYYHQIPNKLSLSYSGLKKNRDSLSYRNFATELSLQHDNIELWQNGAEFTTNNLHIAAQIRSTLEASKAWNYDLSAYYFITGYNQNDWKIDARFSYNLEKFGEFSLAASSELQEASWIEASLYTRESASWENNFKKKQRTRFALDYALKKFQFKAHAEYNILSNFIYFNQESKPEQLNGVSHYWQTYFSKDLQFKILHFDNFIGLQGTNSTEAIRLPLVYLKSSLYIEGKIFKGNMLGRFGLDLRYNSNFAINAWNPLIGQFYIQDQQNMKFTPVLDVFLSFKVKTLRVFAKANYINEGLIQSNYFTALNYPDRGRTFAGGLIWRFFE
ncbi:MAG: putative porin [Chitinophagales bacterium]